MIGARYSLWGIALNLAEKIYSDYLLLTGQIIDIYNADHRIISEFVKWINRHTEIKTIFLWKMEKYYRYILNMLDNLIHKHTDLINRKLTNEYLEVRGTLSTLILTSKWKWIEIKNETWQNDLYIEIVLVGPTDTSIEKAVEELMHMKKKKDGWIVTDYIDQPYINKKYKIGALGRWGTNIRPPEKLKPGAIYITQKGEIKIIRKENP